MKRKTVQDVLHDLRSKSGIRIGSPADYAEQLGVTAISTGNIAIDAITGVGGLARGRIHELYGPPSSGKTTTALQAAARLQQRIIAGQEPGYVMFADYERSFDSAYARSLGLDTDHPSFIYMMPEHFEQGMQAARDLIATGELRMLIVDSVARMTTQHELEADVGRVQVADRAKMMAQLMRQIVGEVADEKVVVVFLNHIQEVIDASPIGAKLRAQGVVRKTTPGGAALKFNAAIRIEFKQVGNLRSREGDPLSNEDRDVVSQTKVAVTVVKNKVAPPFQTCEVRSRFGKGFSQAYSVLDILVKHKVVKKATGGMYHFDKAPMPEGLGVETIRGEENAVKTIESNPVWLEMLRVKAQEMLDNYGTEKVDPVGRDDDGDLVELAKTTIGSPDGPSLEDL